MTVNYCPECGSKITNNTTFCGECGAKVLFAEESPKLVKSHCHSCDYSTADNEIFCPECGSELVSKDNKATPKVNATYKKSKPIKTARKKAKQKHQTIEQIKKKMNCCPECGSKLIKNTTFCGECGAKILFTEEPVEPISLLCKSCNYTTIEDEMFCPKCGSLLTSNIIKDSRNKLKTKPKVKTHPAKPEPTTHQAQNNSFLRSNWITAVVVLSITFMIYNFSDISWDNSTTNNKTAQPHKEVEIRQANPVLSETKRFPVVPTSKKQILSYSDKVTVTLPPNFTSKKQNLNISKAEVNESIIAEDMTPLILIDLTLDNKEQPIQPIDVTFSYNLKELNPDYTPAEQLIAFRWDEIGGGWVNLPIRLDEKDQSISVLVDHFSIISIVKILNDFIRGIDDYDKVNNIYTTPEKNFHILYSKQKIEDSAILWDGAWKSQYSRSGTVYTKNHPRYIQDIGYFLESALTIYASSYGFRSPAGQEKFLNWTYQKSVIVKIDSWYSKVTAFENPFSSSSDGLPSYDKIFERLHIPTSNAAGPDSAKTTTAHELFHAFQAQYYGLPGMLNPLNQWWLEATADYAAFSIAWPAHVNDMYSGLGINYLSFPVNDRGEKKGQGIGWQDRAYEYLTSIWVKYLVDKEGFNFKKMIEYIASNNLIPISSLGSYSYKNHKLSLGDAYHNFANWMTFSSNSPLKSYSLASFDTGGNKNNFIASKRSKLIQGSGDNITYTFNFPDYYSSKLWAVKVTKGSLNKKNERKPISINIKSKTPGISVDIFVVDQGERYLTPPKPIKSIYTDDKAVMIFVKPNELIFVSASAGTLAGGNAEVIISDIGITLEIDPPELENVKAGESNYFTISAKNIPEQIEKVNFEWDYSDGSEKGLDDNIDVSNGMAMIKLMHIYKPTDKEETYPLKVKLKDFYKGMVLAEAQSLVTLSPNKPSLLVTPRHLTGPSGATFDMDAAVSPKGNYRFVWKIEGTNMSHIQTGEKSEFAPIIDKKGRYNVNVKLYGLDNHYLAMDEVTIYVDDDISLIAYQTHFNFKTQQSYNVEAREVYPGLDITFNVNEGKKRANEKYKYIWKINGVKENTAGKYGKWGNDFFLKVEEEARDWSAQIKGGVIGIGVTTVCVEVFDNKGRFIGKDCWTVTVKNPQGEYLDDNIMPDGDEDDY